MKRDSPRISICIPAYNAERYIHTTIESCLQQTLLPFEILLSDDGSSDCTPQILQGYCDQPSVKIVSPSQRLGIGAHYRHLAMVASGTHLVILSCDDALHPDFIQTATQVLMKTSDLGMVAFSGYLCNANMRPQSRFGMSYPRQIFSSPAGFNHFAKSCTYLISFTVWQSQIIKALPPLPDSAGLTTDWYWALATGLQSPVQLSHKPLGYYRYHDKNASHSDYDRWIQHASAMLKFMLECYPLDSEARHKIKSAAQRITGIDISLPDIAVRELVKSSRSLADKDFRAEPVPNSTENRYKSLLIPKSAIRKVIKSWHANIFSHHPNFLR